MSDEHGTRHDGVWVNTELSHLDQNVHTFDRGPTHDAQGAKPFDPGNEGHRASRPERRTGIKGEAYLQWRDSGGEERRTMRTDQGRQGSREVALLMSDNAQMAKRIVELTSRVAELESGAQEGMVRILQRVLELEARFPEGVANSSAALLRDMNEADAEKVIRDLRPHQVVADEVGLTYAQVYSARYEYTFKKVHRRLKEAGFQNPWARRKIHRS